MEGVLRDIQNILVYIDDLLVYTDTHEKHLLVLDQVQEGYTRITSKLTWRSAYSATKKFPIWVSH